MVFWLGRQQIYKLRAPNLFMAKIIKTYDKTVGKTDYYKYRAPLPKAVAEDSGLIDKELKITTKNNKILIEEDKDEKE